MHKILFLLLGIGSILTPLCGQKVLALENPRKFKRTIYEPGDWLRIQTHAPRAWINAQILAVDDSILTLIKPYSYTDDEGKKIVLEEKDYLPFREIRAIRYVGNKNWAEFQSIYAGGAMIGGVFLLAISGVNALEDNDPLDAETLWLTSSLTASGILVALIGRRKQKIGSRWRLRAMEFQEQAPDSQVK